MAIRRTTLLRTLLSQGYGVRDLLRDGRLYIYSGGQPASADSEPSGTLLITFTKDAGTYTSPVKSAAKVTLSGSTGTLDSIKVGGAAYNLLSGPIVVTSGDLGTSADNVAADINARENFLNITATSDGTDTITLSAPFWLGALVDGLTVAAVATTSTVTVNAGSSLTFGGAGSPNAGTTALNGLNFSFPSVSGIISKPPAETWSGTSVSGGGTAGWFRFVSGGSTVTGSGASHVRFDGTVRTSGGDMNAGSLTIQSSTLQAVGTFSITIPSGE